jgi:hypothetical protein
MVDHHGKPAVCRARRPHHAIARCERDDVGGHHVQLRTVRRSDAERIAAGAREHDVDSLVQDAAGRGVPTPSEITGRRSRHFGTGHTQRPGSEAIG